MACRERPLFRGDSRNVNVAPDGKCRLAGRNPVPEQFGSV